MSEHGVATEPRAVETALQHLALRNVLAVQADGDEPSGGRYRWRLGLVGLWVRAYRPLGRVVEEVVG